MTSLVLEGGTFRPIFSCGVMDALLDAEIMLPYIIGVSAGITDGFSYASRQKGRNLEILMRYRNDPRYLSMRNMVTDGATYDKILELLDQNSDPQFIFDVTMQNHSGYDTGMVPQDKQLNLSIDGMYDAEVNEYVSLIQESDRALEYFIDQLRQLDRKVVVVFFGDHQPFFPSTYNDLWFTDEDEATHQERLWQTDYVIWANYDVAGNDQVSEEVDLSTNYLGSVLMDLIGAPMNDYQKAQAVLREAMPAINSSGYEDAEGRWYLTGSALPEDGDAAQQAVERAHSDYATMQYYELFYDGKDVYTKRYQSAANETDPNLAPGTTKIK